LGDVDVAGAGPEAVAAEKAVVPGDLQDAAGKVVALRLSLGLEDAEH
jgi:hypothetical protein